MITITLQQIRDKKPCRDGWEKVLKANGGSKADFSKPFPLSSILESNGLDDTLWTLQCLQEYHWLWRKFAVWCARRVQHLMTDQRSINALDVVWRHSDGLATDEELAAARAAARAAAWAAAGAAARAAAWAAAGAAAWAAAWAAQSAKLKQVIDAGKWIDEDPQ